MIHQGFNSPEILNTRLQTMAVPSPTGRRYRGKQKQEVVDIESSPEQAGLDLPGTQTLNADTLQGPPWLGAHPPPHRYGPPGQQAIGHPLGFPIKDEVATSSTRSEMSSQSIFDQTAPSPDTQETQETQETACKQLAFTGASVSQDNVGRGVGLATQLFDTQPLGADASSSAGEPIGNQPTPEQRAETANTVPPGQPTLEERADTVPPGQPTPAGSVFILNTFKRKGLHEPSPWPGQEKRWVYQATVRTVLYCSWPRQGSFLVALFNTFRTDRSGQ